MKWFLACCMFLFLLAGSVTADVVEALNPDGTTAQIPGVTVMGITVGTDGSRQITLRFPDGSVNPVDFARIVNIGFQPPRAGTLLVGADAATAESHPAVLDSFRDGRFVVRQPDGNQRWALPAANVQGFTATDVPAAAPPPAADPFGGTTAAPPAADPFGGTTAALAPPAPAPTTGGDFFGSSGDSVAGGDSSGAESASFDSESSDGDSSFGDGSMTAEEQAEQANSDAEINRMMGFGIAFIIAAMVFLVLFFTTYFWLMINAFMNGKVGWGIGIMLCGCCLLVKPFYLSHYEGKGKNVVTILVVIEVILNIILNVISRAMEP